MTDLVPREQIEAIVGASRSTTEHIGRAVSEQGFVYILHSDECLNSGIDLRECEYSLAADRGIRLSVWAGFEDRVVGLEIVGGRLHPQAERDA